MQIKLIESKYIYESKPDRKPWSDRRKWRKCLKADGIEVNEHTIIIDGTEYTIRAATDLFLKLSSSLKMHKNL